MKKADIKIGFLCNNFCSHCVQGDKRTIFGNKTFAQVSQELMEARKNCVSVVFTGGEPTIHKDFLKIVQLAKVLGFKEIQLQTNARMFAYPDFCQQAIKFGVTSFCVAVLGHSAKIHDFSTNVPGSFKQVIQGIRNLKSYGAWVADNTVITKNNYKTLPDIANLLVSLGVDQFQFAFPHPFGSAQKNFSSVVPSMQEVMPYVKQGLDIGIAAGKLVMTEAIPYCLMNGYQQYIGEKVIPEAEIFDADFHIVNYSEIRKNKSKAKGLGCKHCKFYSVCEGTWRQYPEHFGWEEFKPVN